MEALFLHWIKNKKGNCDFLSHNSDFFLSQLRVYISQSKLSYKYTILTFFLRIVISPVLRRKKTVLRITSLISHNSDFNSQLQVYITQLWDKKSQLLFLYLIFYSVTETSFHRRLTLEAQENYAIIGWKITDWRIRLQQCLIIIIIIKYIIVLFSIYTFFGCFVIFIYLLLFYFSNVSLVLVILVLQFQLFFS